MSIQERSTAMEKAQACVRCTDWTHKKSNCDAKFGNKPWQDCTVLDGAGKKCGKKHHNLLHGSNNAYIWAWSKNQHYAVSNCRTVCHLDKKIFSNG